MPSTIPTLSSLQEEWKHLYQAALPTAACSRSSAQPRWPVHVDHCFARIVLDNVVGVDVPWMEKLKSPAWKNLNEAQLKECIEMGNEILEGNRDLVALDERSLEIRGKKPRDGGKSAKKEGNESHEVKATTTSGGQAKAKGMKDGEVSRYFTTQNLGKRTRNHDISSPEERDLEKNETSNPPTKKQKPEPSPSPSPSSSSPASHAKSNPDPTIPSLLKQISNSQKTPFQKSVLALLLQIPRGQHTTYGLLAKHLYSSPRAVGNGIRNNPFAPDVPCHRVLATGGGIGGFYGSWGRKGEEGVHDDRKRKLLRDEGVRFDGKGRVVGSPWAGFK